MIRIGFDARALVSPAAGVRRYTSELFGAMATLAGNVQVVAVGGREASLPGNFGWMLSGLPRAIARSRLDVFHAPSYTTPFFVHTPVVLTIHDVSYERHPEWYPYRRDVARRWFYRRSARAAARIVTDSTFSRDEIVAAYGLPADRIDIIPLAPSAVFAPGAVEPHAGVPAPFILHVGDLHPRRNLHTALRAVQRVRARCSELGSLRLVLAGVDRGVEGGLLARGGDAVRLLGAVSEKDLVRLYRAAAAVVYPSLYEGFGLPLLEAMACGTPVIAARAASIPEVCGDAALLLDPHDEVAWADAIEAVCTSDSIATDRRNAGLRHARAFTWTRAAEQTIAVYRRALAI